MRLALSLVVALMTLVSTAHAKSKAAPSQFDGRLITYQQLIRLTPDARRAYLSELRQILVLLEKNQNRYEVASNESSIEKLKKQIASFIIMAELLPTASAETAVGPVNFGSRRPVVPRWNSMEQKWLCNPAPPYVFDPSIGTCVMQYERGGDMVSDRPSCGAKMVEVKNPGASTVRCVPEESWKALSRSRQKEIRAGVRFPEDFFDGEDSDFGRKYTHGGGVYENDGSVIAGNGGEDGGGTRPSNGGPAAPAAPAVPATPEAPKPAETAKPPEEVKPPVAAKPEPPPSAVQPVAPVCKLEKLSCQQLQGTEKQIAIERFRKDEGADTCIAGGYFTKKSQNPAAGKGSCELVDRFRLTTDRSLECKKDKETGKDTALCNPAVFCLALKVNDKVRKKLLDSYNGERKKDADAAVAQAQEEAKKKKKRLSEAEIKAIRDQYPLATAQQLEGNFKTVEGFSEKLVTFTMCAPISQDLTKTCDKRMDEYLSGMRAHEGYEGPGFDYVQCDPSKVKGFPLQSEWEKLAADTFAAYRKQCGAEANSSFRNLFCDECNVVAERIFKANKKAVGTGCADAAPVAGAPVQPQPGEGGATPERGTGPQQKPQDE